MHNVQSLSHGVQRVRLVCMIFVGVLKFPQNGHFAKQHIFKGKESLVTEKRLVNEYKHKRSVINKTINHNGVT